MFRYFYILLVSLLAGAGSVLPQTTSGEITTDETWSGTVTVTGDVVVTSGTLTINPGTVVKFATTNDNIVFGGTGTIFMAITGAGGLKAIGTEDERIQFTTAGVNDYPGSWGRILVVANDNRTRFEYCDFLYCQNGCAIEAKEGYTGSSQVVFDHCHFFKMSLSAIYVNDGNSVSVNNCVMHDLGSAGVFAHGAPEVTITYSYIYDAGKAGVILAGKTEYPTIAVIDHMTMYNIDMMRSSNPSCWSAYGIFCTNDPGELTLTNSIIMMATLAGMKINNWDVTRDYNCWSTGMFGLMNIEDGVPGPNSMEVDPSFRDEADRNLALADTSVCLNAGNDGKHIGAWQEGDWWPPYDKTKIREDSWQLTVDSWQQKQNNAIDVIYDMKGRIINAHKVDRYGGVYILKGKGGVLIKKIVIK